MKYAPQVSIRSVTSRGQYSWIPNSRLQAHSTVRYTQLLLIGFGTSGRIDRAAGCVRNGGQRAQGVNRRDLRPAIGVQCGPRVMTPAPFTGKVNQPRQVGPSSA